MAVFRLCPICREVINVDKSVDAYMHLHQCGATEMSLPNTTSYLCGHCKVNYVSDWQQNGSLGSPNAPEMFFMHCDRNNHDWASLAVTKALESM